MYLERFNSDACKTIMLIREKSVELDEPHMPGTGHLILAFLDHQESIAAKILHELNLDVSKIGDVEGRVRELSPPGEPTAPHIITRLAELEQVLTISSTVADIMKSDEIDTAHILMAIFCVVTPIRNRNALVVIPEINRVGAQVLREYGIEGRKIHLAVNKEKKLSGPWTNLN